MNATTGLFRNRWWVVFATVCALVVGAGPINVFTFGVFLKPITQDLGVGRGVLSSALTLHGVIAAFALPVIGWMVDRWGVRPVSRGSHVKSPGRFPSRDLISRLSRSPSRPKIRTSPLVG